MSDDESDNLTNTAGKGKSAGDPPGPSQPLSHESLEAIASLVAEKLRASMSNPVKDVGSTSAGKQIITHTHARHRVCQVGIKRKCAKWA